MSNIVPCKELISRYNSFYAQHRDVIRELNDLRGLMRDYVAYSSCPSFIVTDYFEDNPFNKEYMTEICEALQINYSQMMAILENQDVLHKLQKQNRRVIYEDVEPNPNNIAKRKN